MDGFKMADDYSDFAVAQTNQESAPLEGTIIQRLSR
jgi:hypothetical protein